jgi:hypothetical protein
VVPFASRDAELETTLLSVLENRPRETEIVVAHDGRYRDPYRLSHDEITLVDAGPSATLVGLINAALRAARGPIIHILFPGTLVRCGWVDKVVDAFRDLDVAGVAAQVLSKGNPTMGICSESLPQHCPLRRTKDTTCASPAMQGGFFRKRVLLALDGFLEASLEGAEVDFGLSVRVLGMNCHLEADCLIDGQHAVLPSALHNYALGHIVGRLGMAYSEIPTSGVKTGSWIAGLGRLAGGLMNPSSVSLRLGWVIGSRDSSLAKPIADRLTRAEEQLSAWRSIRGQENLGPRVRRAA